MKRNNIFIQKRALLTHLVTVGYFWIQVLTAMIFLNQSIDGRDIFEPNYKQRTFLFISHSVRTILTLYLQY